jgi:hypothetical protein
VDTIADFIGTDRSIIRSAFAIQASNTKEAHKQNPVFWNKMDSNYFYSYFSRDAIKKFVYYNRSSMKAMGYEHLCDSIENL